MKFLLTPSGTHGDIRPLAALGISLKNKGQDVVAVSSPDHKDFFEKQGIEFRCVGKSMKKRIEKEPEIATGKGKKGASAQIRYFKEDFPLQFKGILEHAKNADCIIDGGVSMAGKSIAEYYEIPFKHVMVIPHIMRSDKRIPFQYSDKKRSKFLVKLYWAYATKIYNFGFKKTINQCRQEIGLPIINNVMDFYTEDSIVATDKELSKVCPEVTLDYSQVGYFHVEEEGELSEDLVDFIQSGTKPIYIGFGSVPSGESSEGNETSNILNEVIGCKDHRFIVSRGWANILDNSKEDNVKVVDYVPHTKLFPEMGAIVHHGGAGTVHTAALAGVPQIIIPHLADHPYWGFKINKLKLGPKHINRTNLTSEALIAAINETVNNPIYSEKAEEMGQVLKKNDRVNDAADDLIKWVKQQKKVVNIHKI